MVLVLTKSKIQGVLTAEAQTPGQTWLLYAQTHIGGVRSITRVDSAVGQWECPALPEAHALRLGCQAHQPNKPSPSTHLPQPFPGL